MTADQDYRDLLQPNYIEIEGGIFTVFEDQESVYQAMPIDDVSRKLDVEAGHSIIPIREEKRRAPQKVLKASRGPKDCWTIRYEV